MGSLQKSPSAPLSAWSELLAAKNATTERPLPWGIPEEFWRQYFQMFESRSVEDTNVLVVDMGLYKIPLYLSPVMISVYNSPAFATETNHACQHLKSCTDGNKNISCALHYPKESEETPHNRLIVKLRIDEHTLYESPKRALTKEVYQTTTQNRFANKI